jgi:ferredoxin
MAQKTVLRLAVDRERCQGHNRCKKLAPDLIELDDYGLAMVAGDGIVPAAMEEQARLAEANCPEFAVSIVEERKEG